jgi:hypothetical protein
LRPTGAAVIAALNRASHHRLTVLVPDQHACQNRLRAGWHHRQSPTNAAGN